ncbi:hypothetical protein PYW08_006437 [Mythimna loreyi]|uniref:Uncharacterized protein n=1 Tax=Mythimna loreyi TaxID=667449 RepID=A0ACC2QMK2_9NEOP|nr:hypothetical protein PYW08_006437 [Mythimna loreyi]
MENKSRADEPMCVWLQKVGYMYTSTQLEIDESGRRSCYSILIRVVSCATIKPKMGNIVFSIIWFIILIFISFWVAGICAGIYIIVLPFTVCVEPLSGLTDFLLSVIQFPRYCAQAMMEGRGLN